MKKYLLVFLALLLTGAVVMATVLNSNKKVPVKAKKEGCVYKMHCQKTANAACY